MSSSLFRTFACLLYLVLPKVAQFSLGITFIEIQVTALPCSATFSSYLYCVVCSA